MVVIARGGVILAEGISVGEISAGVALTAIPTSSSGIAAKTSPSTTTTTIITTIIIEVRATKGIRHNKSGDYKPVLIKQRINEGCLFIDPLFYQW